MRSSHYVGVRLPNSLGMHRPYCIRFALGRENVGGGEWVFLVDGLKKLVDKLLEERTMGQVDKAVESILVH